MYVFKNEALVYQLHASNNIGSITIRSCRSNRYISVTVTELY